MNICGISVITRKRIVVRRFGSGAWTQFYGDVASSHDCFRSFITANSSVPLPSYLAFHDELMHRFFTQDDSSHLEIGRESSRWALTEGPLKGFFEGRDLPGFVASLPRLHQLYFQDATTWAEASLNGTSVEFRVHNLPHWHPYFEYFIVGYIAEALELFCANPIRTQCVRGGFGKEYHYLFHGIPAGLLEQPGASSGAIAEGRAEPECPLSEREMEVLLLIAQGKTSEEIGVALGISKKTAQNHSARACRKLEVTGRAGATVWLAERGLLKSG